MNNVTLIQEFPLDSEDSGSLGEGNESFLDDSKADDQ